MSNRASIPFINFDIYQDDTNQQMRLTAIINKNDFLEHSMLDIMARLRDKVAEELAPEIKLRVIKELNNTMNLTELIAREAVKKLFKE